MLTIDGAMGEGGGQVLRTALGLSLVTGQPFVIERIRAGRSKPGLQRQHLTAVLAAGQVGDAVVEGAELGSLRVAFRPRRVRAGDYRFAIGTAGSTTLVLQTVLPGLLAADGPSTVELHGGTHNPMAPPVDFLQHAFAPVLHRMGAALRIELVRHGFYPAGGGVVRAHVAPAAWQPLDLRQRGGEPRLRGHVVSSGIPAHVGEREARVLQQRLRLHRDEIRVDEVEAAGPGNVAMVRVGFGPTSEVITSLGDRDVTAEAVANRAADAVQELLATDVPVGEHLADQLLIPLAMARRGAFRTVTPSEHTRTNAAVVSMFLPVDFELSDEGRGTFAVTVRPR